MEAPDRSEGRTLEPLDVAQFIVEVASDKLAEDIVLLDLRGLVPFADYFVIMSAESTRQIEALEEDLTQSSQGSGSSSPSSRGNPFFRLGPPRLQRRDRSPVLARRARILRP